MDKTEAILSNLSKLRDKNPRYFTNAYIGAKDLSRILACDTTEVYESERSIAVFFDDNGVLRLYLFAESIEAAAGFVLPEDAGSFILEIIEQDDNAAAADLFASNGWQIYSRLMQMRYVLPDYNPAFQDSPVEVARIYDTDAVYRMLYDTFDINISHLPSRIQLSEMIENGEILVIRDQEKIAGTAMFQVTGKKTKHFFHLVVGKEYQGKRYAQALVDFEFSRAGKGTVYSLWVVSDYIPAVNLHKKTGFRECSRYLTVFSMKEGK